MARAARRKSITGIYHIIMRGINHQIIFEEEEDRIKLIETLEKYKKICGYKLYAYCLMENHLHLLLKIENEQMGTIMQRICGSYVLWYNKKYGRIGHLFQERFKSEPVEDDIYFLTALRYIFQNPVKASMVTEIQNYPWTNYKDYFNENNRTDFDFVLSLFHVNKEEAVKSFTEFVNQENNDKCIDISGSKQITDDDARRIIKKHFKIEHVTEIQNFDTNKRNACLRDLRETYGLSIRQIERLTGIGRGIIQRM